MTPASRRSLTAPFLRQLVALLQLLFIALADTAHAYGLVQVGIDDGVVTACLLAPRIDEPDLRYADRLLALALHRRVGRGSGRRLRRHVRNHLLPLTPENLRDQPSQLNAPLAP